MRTLSAMTGDTNDATPATSTLGIAFAEAFAAKDYDRFRALAHVETDTLVDRERVGYRLIGWMRIVCSGFRPV
jgi:hypothetical protein